MVIQTVKEVLEGLLAKTNVDFLNYKMGEKGVTFTIADKTTKFKELIGEIVRPEDRGSRHVVATADVQRLKDISITVNYELDGLWLPYGGQSLDIEQFAKEVTSGIKKRPLGALESHIKYIIDDLNSQIFQTVGVLAYTKLLGKQLKIETEFIYRNNPAMPDGKEYFGVLKKNNKTVYVYGEGSTLVATLDTGGRYPQHIIHAYEYFRCPLAYFKTGVALALGASATILKVITAPYDLISVRYLYKEDGELFAYRLRTKSGLYDVGASVMDNISEGSQSYYCYEGSLTLRLKDKQFVSRSEEKSGVLVEDISLNTKKAHRLLRNVGYRQ